MRRNLDSFNPADCVPGTYDVTVIDPRTGRRSRLTIDTDGQGNAWASFENRPGRRQLLRSWVTAGDTDAHAGPGIRVAMCSTLRVVTIDGEHAENVELDQVYSIFATER